MKLHIEGEGCGSCHHSQPYIDGLDGDPSQVVLTDGRKIVECHRFPPGDKWPVLAEDEWCAEYVHQLAICTECPHPETLHHAGTRPGTHLCEVSGCGCVRRDP